MTLKSNKKKLGREHYTYIYNLFKTTKKYDFTKFYILCKGSMFK